MTRSTAVTAANVSWERCGRAEHTFGDADPGALRDARYGTTVTGRWPVFTVRTATEPNSL
ncbi:hypothetical protein ACFPM0_10910 [Pseudonocardia sulfidoxydans]|uniref:hypothetical protein n=1 Tax=Pseudonocardia sulfidoxydans TaxID=54011 RepID=UPI0036169C09